MRILLVRHARVGKQEKHYGTADVPLAPDALIGKRPRLPPQAAEAAVYSSPSSRAVQTARWLTGKDPRIDPRLEERRLGDMEEAAVDPSTDRPNYCAIPPDVAPPNGETFFDLSERVRKFCIELIALGNDPTCVTHGRRASSRTGPAR